MSNRNETNLAQIGFQQGRMRPGEVQKIRAKNSKGTVRRIWDYLKRQKRSLFIVVGSTVLTTFFTLLGPYLIGKTIDDTIVPQDYNGLMHMGMLLLIVYVFGAVFTWVQQYTASSMSQNTVRDMRQDLFEHIQRLPVKFFDSKTHGELMSRATNDVMNVSNVLNQTVVQFISSVLILVGSLAMMLSLSLWMTIVTIFTVPLITTITKKITKYTRTYFSQQQKSIGEVNGFVQENISGLKVTKAFVREEKAIEQFREMNDRLRNIGVKAQSLSGSMGPIMNAMRNLTFVIIAVFGGIFAYYDLITVGIIASFLSYSNQFSQPINQLANQYNMLQAAIAGAERIFEIMDEKPEVYDMDLLPENQEEVETGTAEGAVKPVIKGEVTFDQVTFGYNPDYPVLKNVSLRAKPGQMIALVGPTGAGKTTIINLLTRFYEIQSGSILIDGIDIRHMDKHALRRQIGMVLQDAYVFSGTIRENIRYGRLDATDEEVEQAARLANADTFIRKLPNGYDTHLAHEGVNLSQGQRQLLTILPK